MASWYATSGWTYRKKITIDSEKVGGSCVNFPVLIKKTDTDLKDTANGGNVGQSDGGDILFTSSDGQTKLNHQLRAYTATTGAVVIWVEVPHLSGSNDTDIYMYYGNADAANQASTAATWTSYTNVYHMAEAASGTCADVTGNNDGSYEGDNLPNRQTGKIEYSQLLDGSTDYVDLAHTFAHSSGTIELWVKWTTAAASQVAIWSGDDAANGFGTEPELHLGSNSDGNSGAYFQETGGAAATFLYDGGSAVVSATWYHFAFTWIDEQESHLYINGVLKDSETSSPDFDTTGWDSGYIGREGANLTRNLDGEVEEVRIANSFKSAGWIKTCYNNQNSPSTFISVDSEETEVVLMSRNAVPSAMANVGMNAGHPDIDFDEIYSGRITKIRVDLPDFNDDTNIAIDKTLIANAQASGHYVIWGISSNPTTLTSTNWADFAAAVKTHATWSQNNNVDEFFIGNEEELHTDATISDATLRTNLKALATEVQALFTRGSVGYSIHRSYISEWAAEGLGDIDILGVNIYSTLADFKSKVESLSENFTNSNSSITEFNAQYGFDDATLGMDENQYAVEIAQRVAYIKRYGINTAYFFTYQTAADWGIKAAEGAGDLHDAFQSLFSGRRWFEVDSPARTANTAARTANTAARTATS